MNTRESGVRGRVFRPDGDLSSDDGHVHTQYHQRKLRLSCRVSESSHLPRNIMRGHDFRVITW